MKYFMTCVVWTNDGRGAIPPHQKSKKLNLKSVVWTNDGRGAIPHVITTPRSDLNLSNEIQFFLIQ